MEPKNCNIGFIGGGNMSSAIGRCIIKSGAHPPSQMWVSGPRIENLQHWVEYGANVTIKNGEVLYNCDVVFMGMKPNQLESAIDGCIDTLPQNAFEKKKEVLIISMLAGISISRLTMVLEVLPYQTRIIKMMPNTPMCIGAGACIYTPDKSVTDSQCIFFEELIHCCGRVKRVPEEFIDSLGVVTACGPAFMFIIMEALAEAAVNHGVPKDLAVELGSQMMIGSGRMLLETGKDPCALRDEVCSPGGSTIAGINALEKGQLRETIIRAVDASTLRNKELGHRDCTCTSITNC